MELGRNRDCTGLFESYHVFSDMTKLEKIMARYELPESKELAITAKPDSNPTGLIFRDAFHQDVKKMARDYFEEKQASHKMKPEVFACVLMGIALEIVAAWGVLCGYRVGLFVMPVIGCLLTFNVSHEASHFGVSSKPWVNSLFTFTSAPLCYNSTAWYIQHIVQHHVYTNDEPDVDLYHFVPLVRTSRFSKYCPQYSLQWLAVWMALPTSVAHLTFVVPMDLLTGHIDLVSGTKRYAECENVEDLVDGHKRAIILEMLLSAIFPISVFCIHGPVKGFCWNAVIYYLSSMLFIIFTQGAHLQEQCMASAEEDTKDKSWAKHQVRTAVNFEPQSKFWSFASGGLNMQALHHILPTVSACHLTDMYPRFREVCNKHDVELKEAGNIVEFFKGFLNWVCMLSEDDRLPEAMRSEKAKDL